MKKHLLVAIISVSAFAACQRQYYYHFPKEAELKGISPDSVRWRYSGPVISQVPVANEKGKLFWLDVTPTTKLDVTTIYGDTYRFYLRSISVANGDAGLFGSNAQWTGYDIREHATRTVLAQEISKLTVIADTPAAVTLQ